MISERWAWLDRLWQSVCALRTRYGISVRSGWWESGLQVEALAALADWVDCHDSGEWDDPPGKLSLLYEIELVAGLLGDGNKPFHPDRDRRQFEAFLIDEHRARPTPRASR